MAEKPDEPFNDGFDTWEPKGWLKWREWAVFEPHTLSPGARRFWWIMLVSWIGLLVLALIHPKAWQLPEAIIFVLASAAILARDWAGRRRGVQGL